MTTPDVLVVCTANVARSPLFAALLQAEADARLGPEVVRVGSAGVQARPGQPAAAGSITVANQHARSLEHHRAQHVATVPLKSVRLILTMTDEHNHQLLAGRSALRPRTFLLRELVAILAKPEVLAALGGMPDGTHERVHAVTALADRHRPRRLRKRTWNVPDPIGAELEVYEELGTEFARSASVIAEALYGSLAARGDGTGQRPNTERFS